MRLIPACCLLLAFLGGLPAARGGAEALVLVNPQTSPCGIFFEPKADGRYELAANILAATLEKICGRAFPVAAAAAPPGGRAVLVGDFGRGLAAGLPGDSFVLRATGGQLQISGTTGTGTLFGIFAFLERLGCRWWSHDEADIPAADTLVVEPFEQVTKAVFRQTDIMNLEATFPEGPFKYALRSVNSEKFIGTNGLYKLLEPYAAKHPEFYPYDPESGERGPNQIHFCYTAPGIGDALAEAVDRELRQRGDDSGQLIYLAGMGDWQGGLCQCPECGKAALEDGAPDADGVISPRHSGAMLRMVNRAAELLAAKRPGARIGIFACLDLAAPPTKTRPRENVAVWLPHLRHCVLHPVHKCPGNAGYMADLRAWQALVPENLYVWEYAANFGHNFLFPFPVIRSMAANIREYARLGVRGIRLQGNYVSTGGDLAVLKNWVWSRLLWNPELETDALIREFCTGYYGPAAAAMAEYVFMLEDAAAASPAHVHEFARPEELVAAYLPRELLPKLRGRLEAALAAAAGREPYERRVREAKISLDVPRLGARGPLVEKDGRLVRADLGGEYTYPAAVEFAMHARRASSREWGDKGAYWQAVQAYHGGPLATLSRGEVAVQVAPVLNGMIRQLRFRGRPLLRVGAPEDENYPFSGGLQARLNPEAHCGTPGRITETEVEAVAETGISHWARSPSHRVRQTVGFESDGGLRLAAFAEIISGNYQRHKYNSCEWVAEYLPGDGAPSALEFKDAAGGWQAAEFRVQAGGDRRADIPPGTRALRITFLGQGCRVEDEYLAPAVIGGLAELAPDSVLRITVLTDKGELTETGETAWLSRKLHISPLATE